MNTFLQKVAALVALAMLLESPARAAVEYIHTDALGTPVVMTDSDGNIIQTSEYEPYGKLLNRAVTDGPGYTGHVSDAATGLSYMQQRYYDPQIGRFLSMDPFSTDDGGNFNRYEYAANNPYMYNDPDGRADTSSQPSQEKAQWRANERRTSSGMGYRGTAGGAAMNTSIDGARPGSRYDVVTSEGKSLNYNQKSGEIDNGSQILGEGYAGRGPGLNQPQLEGEQGVGPLPQGHYKIGAQQLNRTRNNTKLLGSMRLTPNPSNNMFGRGGFLIHGDNMRHDQSASEGCIVLPLGVRNVIGSGGYKDLNVYAPRPTVVPIW